jgi:hypothetical protein
MFDSEAALSATYSSLDLRGSETAPSEMGNDTHCPS